MKEKKQYSVAGKLLVFFLLFVFAGSAVFGAVQVLALSNVGLTPNTAAKHYRFEQTTACGNMVQKKLHDVMNYYDDTGKFGTDGTYDGTKELDFLSYASSGEKTGGKSTTYTLDQLAAMYGTGDSDDLEYAARAGVENWASNDAGIDKEAYQDYENGSYAYEDGTESAAASTDETASADAAGGSAEEQKTFETFTPDGEIYVPSQKTQDTLKAQKINMKDVSSQFLYLYEQGVACETETTKAGTYLYEYAAEHPEEISLRDLYIDLFQVVDEVAEFKEEAESLSSGNGSNETNLWYCLEDAKGNVYTNVEAWKDGYEAAIAQKTVYHFGLAMDRLDGTSAVRTTYKHNPSVEAVKGYLQDDSNERYQKILVVLDPELTAGDSFSAYSEIFEQWKGKMPLLLAMIAIGGIGALICLVLLTLQAGRNPKDKEIRLYFFDRWYTEFAAAAALIFAALGVGIVAEGVSIAYDSVHYVQNFNGYYVYGEYGNEADMWRTLVTTAAALGGMLVLLLPYCSLVRRIKARNLWKQSFLYKIGHKVTETGRTFYEGRKESERMVLMFCVFCGVQLVLCSGFGAFGILLVLILDAAVLLYLLREASGRRKIEYGLKEIAGGDLEYKIDETELQGENLQMAGVVNSLGEGLKAAVQEQMKSERLKADLITNVSHDIKTPLTSIINYVDLLKRENIENEKAKAYIHVLDEKSQRLKQLTEDLVEASKISSGNIKLEFMNLNLNELVQQVNGEFAERFESRNLELICILQPEPLVIRADSRRIWRVLENLYVNVCKYAMPGTRVYVDAIRKDGKIQFSIKNISENALNIRADELTERFIRGDVSRSTEGSGLGLSIAKNLTILQHGTFDIYLDGDLFKVMITFDEVKKEKQPEKKRMENVMPKWNKEQPAAPEKAMADEAASEPDTTDVLQENR